MCQPGRPEEMGVLYPASNPQVRVRWIVAEISRPWDTATSFLKRPVPEGGETLPWVIQLMISLQEGPWEQWSRIQTSCLLLTLTVSYLVAMKNRI